MSPSKGWGRGEIYQDVIFFEPVVDLNGPSLALLQVELYDGDERLPVLHDGQPINEAVVERFVLRPEKPTGPEEQVRFTAPIQFGGLFELIGLETNLDENTVTLWWQVAAETGTDYTVFIHLIDENGRIVAQSDQIPNNGLSPTSIWQADDIIRDSHYLPVDLSSGTSLLIGAYDLNTLNRVPATQNGNPLPDNIFRFDLPVEVED